MSNSRSELRQDIVSGDWIVISPGRANRPDQLVKKNVRRVKTPKNICIFENLEKSGQPQPILIYGEGKNWKLQVIENKYPAFTHKHLCSAFVKSGPFQIAEAVGYHELVITRDHHKNFAGLPASDARQVFEAFRDRYLMIMGDKCISYVSIFHNWGPKAGASIYHPHYQIAAMPVIPPDISHSLKGSDKYFAEHKRCVHCVMLDWELKQKRRIICQNDGAVAFCPFVSKEPFEIRVFPKKHSPYFENTLDEELDFAADVFQKALKKMEKNLRDPDYNFFIHTAPVKNKERYHHYHWHIEAIPKITIRGGFELGTGVQINVVNPDDAADFLKR